MASLSNFCFCELVNDDLDPVGVFSKLVRDDYPTVIEFSILFSIVEIEPKESYRLKIRAVDALGQEVLNLKPTQIEPSDEGFEVATFSFSFENVVLSQPGRLILQILFDNVMLGSIVLICG